MGADLWITLHTGSMGKMKIQKTFSYFLSSVFILNLVYRTVVQIDDPALLWRVVAQGETASRVVEPKAREQTVQQERGTECE